jgi:hypothetical protein
MSTSPENSGALAPGGHAFDSDGVTERYHVYGSGPVCLAHPARDLRCDARYFER